MAVCMHNRKLKQITANVMTVKYKKHYLALQTAASDTATDCTVHLRAELHGAVLHSAAVCRSQNDHYF